MPTQTTLWISFNVFVLAMLALDQIVFHRKAHDIKMKEAIGWSVFWICLALLFNVWIYFLKGSKPALEFFSGYLIELSLSVDNLFVFIVIFSYFRVPTAYQHTVLFWGILGAQVMRAAFIFMGVALIRQFHWIIYVFGGFLILTGIKMFSHKEKEIHPEHNIILKIFKRLMPVAKDFHGDRFFIRENLRLAATPLFIVLLVVETTDLVFAVDSVPAVLAITLDPFIAYSSNVFAILGLRALYFVLARVMQLFHYLHYGLSFILTFVGVKMAISKIYHIPVTAALAVVILTLTLSVAASLIWPKPQDSKKLN